MPAMNYLLIHYFAVRQRLAHFLVHILFIIFKMNMHSHSWITVDMCARVLVRTRLRRRSIIDFEKYMLIKSGWGIREKDRYTVKSDWSATQRLSRLATLHSPLRSGQITRGHTAPLLAVAPPKFPMIIQWWISGTSYVRGPLSEIAERPFFFIVELMLSKHQYLSPTGIDQFCGYLPAMNHL